MNIIKIIKSMKTISLYSQSKQERSIEFRNFIGISGMTLMFTIAIYLGL